MRNGLDSFLVDKYLKLALEEDITSEDITTNSTVKKGALGTCDLICKEDGILCGIDVFKRVFELIGDVKVRVNIHDGDSIGNKQLIAVIEGDMRKILKGERVALNYLQRMSGIATLTADMVNELEGSKTKLLDTRKTTPNMRVFEKYSVRVGGGFAHRYNLSDGVLIKDNHIGAAGGIKKAIKLAKDYAPFGMKIEIEVEDLDSVNQALEAGADIIMLDNMDNSTLKKAVKLIGDKALTECSGNVTKERLKELKEIGINYISSGALTHSAKILDFSLKNLKAL